MTDILIYNVEDSRKLAKIKLSAIKTGLKTEIVEKENFGKPLYSILNIDGIENTPEGDGEDFKDEMLVFCNITNSQLNMFLKLLKGERAQVTLKAVVTEHNVFWTSSKLHSEISQEHKYMTEQKGTAMHEKSE